MREMSSSSAMSRVTRSASASTVSSISRFWSSVNRSHLASSVAVKPLTEVSGRAELVGDGGDQLGVAALGAAAGLGVAEGDDDAADGAGGRGAHVARGDEDLTAAGEQQVALGLADADGEAAVGIGQLPPAAAFEVL